MRDWIFGIGACLMMVALINLIIFLPGLMEYSQRDSSCKKPMRRIELLFPGFIFGCWLAAPYGGGDER